MILEELLGTSGCMFGIVVLHEAVVVWVDFMQEGNKCFLTYSNVCLSIHHSIEDTYTSPSLKTDPGPNVHLHRMFGSEIRS